MAVYDDYNSRSTKEISFGAFFKSVTTKDMYAYVKTCSDFSFFSGQKLDRAYYGTLLENPTLGIQRYYRSTCRRRC